MRQPCISKSLGVFFNVADPEQKKIYDYAKTLFNFSGHIKKLLLAEMHGTPIHDTSPIIIQTKKEDDNKYDFDVKQTPESLI